MSVNSFFQAFGFFTAAQFEKAKQVKASYGENDQNTVTVKVKAVNICRALGGVAFGPFTGTYNIYHLVKNWDKDVYNHCTGNNGGARNTAFKIGSLVHAILEILCLSLIADLLVTAGRALHGCCRTQGFDNRGLSNRVTN